MKLFFSVQLGHLKLSGYGLLSTQGVQNRSQNCRSISQSEVILEYMRDPGSPAELRWKGVNWGSILVPVEGQSLAGSQEAGAAPHAGPDSSRVGGPAAARLGCPWPRPDA